MSILGRKVSFKAVAAVVAVLVMGTLIPLVSKAPSREITLVAKGMAFYLADDPNTPNPVIDVRAGEQVRLTFRNEDRGMTHDFAAPAIAGAAVDLVDWKESADTTWQAPSTPGTYRYVCRPHSAMMHGIIRVVAP